MGFATNMLRRLGSVLRESDTEALTILKGQHRAAEALFMRIERQKRPSGKARLFRQLASDLTMHAIIEERHFYPAVRASQTEELVSESLEEHRRLKRLITELDRLEGKGAFDDKLAALKKQIHHHAREEEEARLFPLCHSVLDADQREAIGQQMIATMVDLQQKENPGFFGHPKPLSQT